MTGATAAAPAPPECAAGEMPGALPARPLTLLLLFADTGGGHRASARAVAGALARRHPGEFDVRLLDPFAEAAPAPVGRIVGLYSPLIRHAPWAWGAGYHLTDSRAAVRVLHEGFLRFCEPGLARAFATARPAAVVSFHPLLNDVSARVLRRLEGAGRPPLITVVTDLVDVHAAWTCPDVDAVITASPGGLDHCRRAGIPAERCHDLGLPVGADFTRPPAPGERVALRGRLGLPADRFTVLVTGGGEGSGGLHRRVAALASAGLPIQLVAVCGRNTALRTRLAGLDVGAPTHLHVEGFVANMADWMRASDVVVTKAGPGTIVEALCSGTPVLLTAYVPGQERGNVELVVDTGSGRWVPRVHDLVDAVRELGAPGSPGLASMRRALEHAARPEAADRIATLIRSMALGAGAPR